MKIIVVGCGRVGAELAARLSKRGHDVAVVDSLSNSFSNLPTSFKGRLIDGDALNRDTLHRAGIEKADALAAVTNSDALNLVVGRLACKVFNIPRVVVRNYNPDYMSLFEIFGLQVISSSSWGAQRIEEMIYHSQIRTIFSAGNGEVEFYEVSLPDAWDQKRVRDFGDIRECVVVSITRAGRAFLPEKDTILHAGDVLHISATFDGIEEFRKRVLPLMEEV